MREIPKNIIDDVNKITNELIVYKNEKKLSWNKSYQYILEKLNIQDKKEDHKLLSNVVTELTRLGYDITDNPFKLDKFL